MQSLTHIRSLLEARGLSPKKSLGQNFLIDHNLIRRLVDASGVGEGDLVLEVGPGTGALTTELLERGCRVVACELDAALSRLLRETLGASEPERFTLVEGDCLANKRELAHEVVAELAQRPFTLVANLPYHAATPLMLALLTRHPECAGQFVTIQKEVGERLEAGPGTKAYGSISVIAQTFAEVSRLATLPRECFWPRPEVTSVMMALRRRPDAPGVERGARLADRCQTLFASRRKQLGAVTRRLGAQELVWPEGVRPTDRVEALPPERVVALIDALTLSTGDAGGA
ncbi:MAG: 16S rRNA (adenine(1518)-N(6)/adenine(1519)-N(6))-dimethyltransferase RsmA [Phycisphaerales bacterium JB059]